jgi:crossover junction endodeoxyribonuclease RuvC
MKKTIHDTRSTIRVLGIDPGTAITGWAVLEEQNGLPVAIAFGHITTSKDLPDSERILEINTDIAEILEKYQPDEAAIEKIFFFKNQKTVIEVSQSRGAVLLTLERKNVRIFDYTPLQVKQSLTGYGRAEKKQVQLMTQSILKLKSLPKPDDVADAIAIAICHINSRKFLVNTI